MKNKHIRPALTSFVWFLITPCFPCLAHTETVTFGTSSIDKLVLAGVQVEGAVEYEALTGLGWEIVNTADSRGNPPSALATYFNRLPDDQSIGDEVEFRLSGGGLFRFLSVDTRVNFNPATSDRVMFIGTRDGVPVGAFNPLPTLSYTSTNGFDGLIDTLSVRLIQIGANAFWIDNVEIAIVPEPATHMSGLTLLGIALATKPRRCLGAGKGNQPPSDAHQSGALPKE